MASIVVPGLDLAPSVPSRIVTVDVIDMTEGLPAAGAKIDFILPQDLHATSDGKVLKAGTTTLELDANGHGEIRVPAYSAATRPEDWVILVKKGWAPHAYPIRVAPGATAVSLASLETPVEVNNNMAKYLLTDASATISEGAQWGVNVSTAGNIANFAFTAPPGGTAWRRGTLDANTDLDTLHTATSSGTYGLSAARTYPGMPYTGGGTLLVDVTGLGSGYQEIHRYQNGEVYRRNITNASSSPVTWSKWERVDGLYRGALSPDISLDTLSRQADSGMYGVSGSTGHPDLPFNGAATVFILNTGLGTGVQEAFPYQRPNAHRRALLNAFTTPPVWGPWETVQQTETTTGRPVDIGAPVESDTTLLTMWGDSLTHAGDIRSTLASLMPTTTVVNRGVSGQNAAQIAARQGGSPSLLTVEGGVVPAEGTVGIMDRTVGVLGATGYPAKTMTGYLYGVHGTLSVEAGKTTYQFTRTEAGVAVTVPPLTPFWADEGRTARRGAQIIWMGRNNFDTVDPSVYLPGMLDYLSPARKLVVVLGITTTPSEYLGTEKHRLAVACNQRLAAIAGDYFLDVRRWLIDEGLAAVGVSPTEADLTAIAGDTVPPSLTTDGVHFTSVAQTAIGTWLHGELVRLQMYSI